MASITATNPTTPPAKRQRTTLQPATIEALKEKHAEPINITEDLTYHCWLTVQMHNNKT